MCLIVLRIQELALSGGFWFLVEFVQSQGLTRGTCEWGGGLGKHVTGLIAERVIIPRAVERVKVGRRGAALRGIAVLAQADAHCEDCMGHLSHIVTASRRKYPWK